MFKRLFDFLGGSNNNNSTPNASTAASNSKLNGKGSNGLSEKERLESFLTESPLPELESALKS